MLGFFQIDRLLRLLNKRQYIAHAQNALGHPVGMKQIQGIHLLPNTHKLNGHARDCPCRKRRSTASIPLQLGEDQTIQVNAPAELLRYIDRILTGESIYDQQRLRLIKTALDLLDLRHHLLVNMQATGGVND